MFSHSGPAASAADPKGAGKKARSPGTAAIPKSLVPSAAACPVTAGNGEARLWLCDTGCPYDLTSANKLTEDERSRVRPRDSPNYLDTANGELEVDKELVVEVEALVKGGLGNSAVTSLVLPDTPEVLTVGTRCEEGGYGFYWPPYSSTPLMIPPGACAPRIPKGAYDSYIQLQSIGCVPYLQDYGSAADANPACPVIHSACGAGEPEDVAPPLGNELLDNEDKDSIAKQLVAPDEFYIGDEENDPPPTEKRDVIAEAKSLHHMITHDRFNPYCKACVRAGAQRKHKRAKKKIVAEGEFVSQKFGKNVTGDHLLDRRNEGTVDDNELNDFPDARAAVVLYDRGTDWLDAFPKGSKSGKDTKVACQEFAGPDDVIESFYADNAPERPQQRS